MNTLESLITLNIAIQIIMLGLINITIALCVTNISDNLKGIKDSIDDLELDTCIDEDTDDEYNDDNDYY